MELILKHLLAGDPVPHAARFAFASFCMKMGLGDEEIAGAFQAAPNFNLATTIHQLDSLRSGDYSPYSCVKMAAYGLCAESIKAPLCGSITNPLSFGRIRAGRAFGPG